MKDTTEAYESPEKQITKTPEKKIDTFDNLQASDKTQEIDTFDNIAMREGSERSIQTFDDISRSKEGTINQAGSEVTEKETSVNDLPEALEQKRLDQAAGEIKKIDWMKSEEWKTLDNDKKAYALRHAGRELGETFKNPDPPLMTKKWGEPGALGAYGDGPSYDSKGKKWVGDYGIEMNEEGYNYDSHKKLFGEDPKAALETYAHEFRHSYQNEQAHAFDKDFRTDNPDKAREWLENLKDYKYPPNAELAKTDPERHFKEYEAYRNQPVERDAREFGEKLKSEVYRDTQDKKEK